METEKIPFKKSITKMKSEGGRGKGEGGKGGRGEGETGEAGGTGGTGGTGGSGGTGGTGGTGRTGGTGETGGNRWNRGTGEPGNRLTGNRKLGTGNRQPATGNRERESGNECTAVTSLKIQNGGGRKRRNEVSRLCTQMTVRSCCSKARWLVCSVSPAKI